MVSITPPLATPLTLPYNPVPIQPPKTTPHLWFPYYTTSVLTQHPPFQAPPSPPLTFPHTILPHVKVMVKQFLALVPWRRGSVEQCFSSLLVPIPLLWATRPRTAPVGSSSPYRSCGLLVPVPLLWATRPRTAPVGYSSPYRSYGLLVPVPLLWATHPRTAPVGYSSPYRSCGLLVPVLLLRATRLLAATQLSSVGIEEHG